MLLTLGLIMSGISMFIYYHDNHFIETFVYIIAIILSIYRLYLEKLKNITIAVLWIIMSLTMIDAMISILYDISIDLLAINGGSFKNLGVSLISLLFVYVMGKNYRKNIAAGMNTIGRGNLFWFTCLLVADTVVITIIEYVKADLELEKFRAVYLIAVIFIIIGVFIQLAAVILLFMQRNVYKEKKQLTEKYLNDQKNHYEYLEKRERETKKFRHDFRSHLELISNMAKNHEYEQIIRYLEKLHIKIDELGNVVTVHNGIVDAIINQYYVKAGQQGINMEVKGRFPSDCEIDAFDICTIFSNVLSNALEAASETEEKFVSVECRYTDRNIIIVARNSFCSQQQSAGTWLRTKKENSDCHGYGLENMKDSVKKYNGLFDIEADNNFFTLTILFNNVGKESYENCNCG